MGAGRSSMTLFLKFLLSLLFFVYLKTDAHHTMNEIQKIHVILRWSENTFSL